mmetsp:Transcript_17900/g.48651  ORF Transcript_17900/g.48651 Transcript_17900/m.48651 type:complete len:117 (+) Transcript_17900:482-832(+)
MFLCLAALISLICCWNQPKPSLIDSQDTMAPSFSMPAKIRDEFPRTAAVYCLSIVFSKTGMKQYEQQELMYKCYHGDATKVSQKSELANGKGACLTRRPQPSRIIRAQLVGQRSWY